jgi:hypothetical protein
VKDSALLQLRDELLLSGLEVPSLTYLKTKIKNLKATYRQELHKVLESTTSGKGTDDVYEPKLVWFKLADSFLRNVTISRPSSSNLVSVFFFKLCVQINYCQSINVLFLCYIEVKLSLLSMSKNFLYTSVL